MSQLDATNFLTPMTSQSVQELPCQMFYARLHKTDGIDTKIAVRHYEHPMALKDLTALVRHQTSWFYVCSPC
jgi:hypothetical protein